MFVWVIRFVISTIVAIIMGYIAKSIMKKKNHENADSWFLWGFFFGIIAVVVALFKPKKMNAEESAE